MTEKKHRTQLNQALAKMTDGYTRRDYEALSDLMSMMGPALEHVDQINPRIKMSGGNLLH